MQTEVERLTAEYGTLPPPWALYDYHPCSMGWRMGAGESYQMLYWQWWSRQEWSEAQTIAYFRQWPLPPCWLPEVIYALWGANDDGDEAKLAPYFERTQALGFGSRDDYERDLNDPKWLQEGR